MSQRHVKFHGSLGGQGALRAAITMVVFAVFFELLAAWVLEGFSDEGEAQAGLIPI